MYYHPFLFFTSLWEILLCMRPKGGDFLHLSKKPFIDNKRGKELDKGE